MTRRTMRRHAADDEGTGPRGERPSGRATALCDRDLLAVHREGVAPPVGLDGLLDGAERRSAAPMLAESRVGGAHAGFAQGTASPLHAGPSLHHPSAREEEPRLWRAPEPER